MGFVELFMIAVGLSMDAFAVSVCKGLGMRKVNYLHALVIALFFGAFQGLMPVLGWLLGTQFESYITSIDHWIAFGLLGFIGGKMIWDAFHEGEGGGESCDAGEPRLSIRELLVLAIATSIDALAIGITLAFLNVDIAAAAVLIAITTFALAFIGVVIGNRFGSKYQKRASIFGGVVLIAIGVKILLEHLGIIG